MIKNMALLFISILLPSTLFALNPSIEKPSFLTYYRISHFGHNAPSTEKLISRAWLTNGSYVDAVINPWFSTVYLNASRYSVSGKSCQIIEVFDRVSLDTIAVFDLRKIDPDANSRCSNRSFYLSAISHTGKEIVVNDSKGTQFLLRSDGSRISVKMDSYRIVNTPQVYFSRDNKKVVFIGNSNSAAVVDVLSGAMIRLKPSNVNLFSEFGDLTFPLWWSRDNRFLAARTQWSLVIWSSETGEIVFKKRFGNGTMYIESKTTTFDSQGRFLTIGHYEQTLFIKFEEMAEPQFIDLPRFCKHSNYQVNDISSQVYCVAGGNNINIFDLRSGNSMSNLKFENGLSITGISLSDDKNYLLGWGYRWSEADHANVWGVRVYELGSGMTRFIIPYYMNLNDETLELIHVK